jgi:Pyruvate/2-oxoacid:ferredoxin oxidoreductase delta subunit
MRVIAVNHVINAENRVHTYDQVKRYIETSTPLAVSTCYCRHQAKLVDERNYPTMDLDQCIGCGLCATGCPTEAIMMEKRLGIPVPPANNKALKKAIQDSLAS